MSDTNPAGWHPDPTGRHDHRYWDGTGWTDNVADAGVAGTDPLSPAADDTATWPNPGAPVPPTPTSPAGAGGGGSRKGLLIGAGILAAIVVAVIVAIAMGGGDSSEVDTATVEVSTTSTTVVDPGDGGTTDGGTTDGGTTPSDFVDLYASVFEQTLGLSQDQAECLAQEVNDAVEAGDISEADAATAFFDYLDKCDISPDDIGTN